MIKKIFGSVGHRIRNFLRSERKKSIETPAAQEASPVASPDAASGKAGERADLGEQVKNPAADGGSKTRPSKRRRKRKPDWDISKFQVEPATGESRFHDFALPDTIMHAVFDLGFTYCTPVQAKALPVALRGRDLVGRANTGTGKTAVFLIAVFSKLLQEETPGRKGGRPRALIIAPTRELVVQIAKDGRGLAKYTTLQIVPVFGGVNYRTQIQDIREKRCDVVVATPGRLLDYLGKNILSLDDCGIMIIDEADRMLDMGFIPDVRRIIHRIPEGTRRQTMLFSATVTEEVRRLAGQWCKEPVSIEIEPEQVAVESVDQIVYLVTTAEKYDVLYNLVKKHPESRILVFTNQKNEARKLSERLKRNDITCNLLTGDVPQQHRTRRLEEFRDGKVPVLVATDVAGRGIHVEDVCYVVNYTLPYEPEDYVHRIGRTGRAGAAGTSISFACEEGSFYLPQIEEFLGRKLECVVPDEDLLVPAPRQGVGTGIKKEDGRRRKRRP
jgi:ATP-dependent RNA helicase RhlB